MRGNLISKYRQFSLLLGITFLSAYLLTFVHRSLSAQNTASATLNSPYLLMTLKDRTDVTAISFAPNGKILAGGNAYGEITLWDLTFGNAKMRLPSIFDQITTLVFSQDGQTLAAGSLGLVGSSGIRLWNPISGKPKWQAFLSRDDIPPGYVSMHPPSGPAIIEVSFFPGQQLLGSGSADKKIRFWNLQTGQFKRAIRIKQDDPYVDSVAFSPTTAYFVVGDNRGTLKLYDQKTGRVKRTFKNDAGVIAETTFSSNGKLLATGSLNGLIQIWDVATGEVKWSSESYQHQIMSLAFSHDNKYLATAIDKKIIILDVASKKVKYSYAGHTAPIWKVAFSPDDKTLASSSEDKTIKLWSLQF